MNRHFEDTVYYLKRAVATATAGLSEELGPVERRVRAATGREEESEPSRVDAVRADLEALAERAEREVRRVLDDARDSLPGNRGGREGKA